MKIAFASVTDPLDVSRGSGTWTFLCKALEAQGCEVVTCGALDVPEPLMTRSLKWAARRSGSRYLTFLDPFVAERRGQLLERRLAQRNIDAVLTNDFGIAAAYRGLEPLFVYTDVMLPPDLRREQTGSKFKDLWKPAVPLFRRTIRRGIEKSRATAFPARWASDAAEAQWGHKEKLAVIPFGANLPDVESGPVGRRSARWATPPDSIRLLLVASSWHTKRGDIALDAVRRLNAAGGRFALDVIGEQPPPEAMRDPALTFHGFLRKDQPDDLGQLMALYEQCDLLVLPSPREGLNVSILEAFAFGLPVVAFDTVGVNDSVAHRETGWLVPLTAGAEAFAEGVRQMITDAEFYRQCAQRGRDRYQRLHRWSAVAERLLVFIQSQSR